MREPLIAFPSAAKAIQRKSHTKPTEPDFLSLLAGLERITAKDKHSLSREQLVHTLRVQSKRLRALLELVRGEVPNSFYTSQKRLVQSAARSLSGSRDFTVICEEIAKCAHTLARRKREKAQAFLRTMREERQTKQCSASVKQSRRELDRALERFGSVAARQLHLSPALKRSYGRARSWMLTSRKCADGKFFHRWRKWAKRLHLQMQLLGVARVLPGVERYNALDTFQKKLGRHRDLLLTEKYLSANKAPKVLLKPIRHTRRDLEEKILRCGRTMFSPTPRDFVAELFSDPPRDGARGGKKQDPFAKIRKAALPQNGHLIVRTRSRTGARNQ